MMKEPNEADYDVKVGVRAVEVTFKPTSSRFTYNSRTALADPGNGTSPPIITSPTGDTYWSSEVQAMAGQLALKLLPRRRRRTLIGAATGAGFGLIFTLLVIDRTPDSMYVPQTTIGVVVAHLIEIVPWTLLGATMGFFSAIMMSKTSKMFLGAAIGAGFGLIILAVLAALVGAPLALDVGLPSIVSWALIFAAIGFFTGQRFMRPAPDDGGTPMSEAPKIFTVIVVVIALLVLGATTTYVYGNSAEGIAHVAGELIGIFLVPYLLTLLWPKLRRSGYTFGVVLALSTIVIISHKGQLILATLDVNEGFKLMQGVPYGDETQLEKLSQAHPSNNFLKLYLEAFKAGNKSARSAAKLTQQIEPPEMANDSKRIDEATATRAQLEAYRHDLKTAEQNADAAMPRFLEIVNVERARVERFGLSLGIEKSVLRGLLAGMDNKNARAVAFSSKMITARAEYFRALGNSLDILIEQYGNFQVQNDHTVFANQSIADRYNATIREVDAATQHLAALDEERKRLLNYQQTGWQTFLATGK